MFLKIQMFLKFLILDPEDPDDEPDVPEDPDASARS
jgi:hypothetical protein